MKIVSGAYADPTQFDPNSVYYDAKSPLENPRWLVRDVQFEREFRRVVSLTELREIPELEGMPVLMRGQRLSVMPISADHWHIVLNIPGI
jgi:predicted RNA-binding protein with PUA-like domain